MTIHTEEGKLQGRHLACLYLPHLGASWVGQTAHSDRQTIGWVKTGFVAAVLGCVLSWASSYERGGHLSWGRQAR
jgi:hypothetical protein